MQGVLRLVEFVQMSFVDAFFGRVNLEKGMIFSREEGEDLRSWKNLQKTRRKKQSSSFGHRCGAC